MTCSDPMGQLEGSLLVQSRLVLVMFTGQDTHVYNEV